MNPLQIQVILVDDNDSFRQSTAWLLEAANMQVLAFASAEQLLAEVDQINMSLPGCCLLTDLRMPTMNGLELMEAVRQRRLEIPVVMITGHGDVALAVEAMRRGASHFIEKPFDAEVLISTLQLAVTEPSPLLRDPAAARGKLERLSPREKQVLKLVCAGNLNKTIADILGISIKTVELHRANMVAKLGARNIQDLVRLSLGYV